MPFTERDENGMAFGVAGAGVASHLRTGLYRCRAFLRCAFANCHNRVSIRKLFGTLWVQYADA